MNWNDYYDDYSDGFASAPSDSELRPDDPASSDGEPDDFGESCGFEAAFDGLFVQKTNSDQPKHVDQKTHKRFPITNNLEELDTANAIRGYGASREKYISYSTSDFCMTYLDHWIDSTRSLSFIRAFMHEFWQKNMKKALFYWYFDPQSGSRLALDILLWYIIDKFYCAIEVPKT